MKYFAVITIIFAANAAARILDAQSLGSERKAGIPNPSDFAKMANPGDLMKSASPDGMMNMANEAKDAAIQVAGESASAAQQAAGSVPGMPSFRRSNFANVAAVPNPMDMAKEMMNTAASMAANPADMADPAVMMSMANKAQETAVDAASQAAATMAEAVPKP